MAIGRRSLGGRPKPPVQEQIKSWAGALKCSMEPKNIRRRRCSQNDLRWM
ncbi:MAG: hypothetical protein GY866_01855 [Proteobacteria bacterium]|nr:hypothetical protein [Pseudomonadota bacterium]